MKLRPCLRCPVRKTCEKKKAIHKQTRGLGLTAASFICRDKEAMFPPGTRLSYFFKCDPNPYDGYDQSTYISGTVMRWYRHKLLVWLDEETPHGHHIIVKVYPDLTMKLDEPLAEVCKYCGRPKKRPPIRHSPWCDHCEAEFFQVAQALGAKGKYDEIPF